MSGWLLGWSDMLCRSRRPSVRVCPPHHWWFQPLLPQQGPAQLPPVCHLQNVWRFTIDLCYGNIPKGYKSRPMPSLGRSVHSLISLLPLYHRSWRAASPSPDRPSDPCHSETPGEAKGLCPDAFPGLLISIPHNPASHADAEADGHGHQPHNHLLALQLPDRQATMSCGPDINYLGGVIRGPHQLWGPCFVHAVHIWLPVYCQSLNYLSLTFQCFLLFHFVHRVLLL